MSNPSSPPGPDVDLAPRILVPCGILAVISLGLCTARIYTRCRPKLHLKWDDYLILLAEICYFFGYVTIAIGTSYGWGHASYYITPDNRALALKCSFASQILWMQAIALARLSIASSLLPLGTSRSWKGTLCVLIGIQIALYVGWMVVTLFNCRPLRSFWDTVPDMKCWPTKVTLDYGWASAVYFVLMDLTLAIMPIQLIQKLNRPRSEKILVGGLMALGLLTTATSGAKMSTFQGVYKGDPLSATIHSSLLAKLEEQVGIICACLPTLKGPAERLLIRLGVLSDQVRQTMSRPSFVISMPSRTPAAAPHDVSALDSWVATREHNGDTMETESADGSKFEIAKSASGQTSLGSERSLGGKGSKDPIRSPEV